MTRSLAKNVQEVPTLFLGIMVLCLGEEHARSALERVNCPLGKAFKVRKLCSRIPLFDDKVEFVSAPDGSGQAKGTQITGLTDDLSVISSGLDNLPSGVSSFKDLDVEGGYESSVADGKPSYTKSNEELLEVFLLNAVSSCTGVNSAILTLFLVRC